MSNPTPITLDQLFRFYRKGLPHQAAAVKQLEEALQSGRPYADVMRRDQEWFQTWSQDGRQPAKCGVLDVPYFSQMDDEHDFDGPGYRHCCSSSCAMLAAFHGKVKTDDAYRQIRRRFGDTTNPIANVGALQELGLLATFRSNGTPANLYAELDAGRPVAVGWLHHGPAHAPTGGGHWSVIIGYTNNSWIMHDPYGEANLSAGGYISTVVGAGRGIDYLDRNWRPRWVPGGSDGWMITARAGGS
jgi:hypothetical protein